MYVRGIDSDNYDGVVPESHFRRLYQDFTVKFNIIGLEARMPYAAQQKQACESAGMMVPFGYKFLYWTDDDLERMKDACRFQEPIAIDEEWTVPAGWSPARVIDRIGAAKDLLTQEGLFWGHYTGAWWWPANTGNTTIFSGDRLWHAAYPFGNGVVPPMGYLPAEPTVVNYGGWSVANVHQYADACYLDEVGAWHFDMNAANEAILGPVKPVPAPNRVITAISQEFFDGDKVRFALTYSDGSPIKVVEA